MNPEIRKRILVLDKLLVIERDRLYKEYRRFLDIYKEWKLIKNIIEKSEKGVKDVPKD